MSDAFRCRAFSVETKAIRESDRSVDVVMSTDAIDAYGEIVRQDGWDLRRFTANPVVLAFHDSRSLPIGRAERVRVENGALQCTIRFASAAANPMAEQCFRLFQERVLNAVSVGFIGQAHHFEKIGDDEVLVFTEAELVELSVVTVPANPEALAKMKALAKERAAQTTTTCGASAATKETTMDLEKQLAQANEKALAVEKEKAVLESKLTESAKALEDARKERDAARLDADANKKALESVTAERDKACSELADAKKSITTAEVDALVGRKFAPAERDAMLELALTNPALFKKSVEARPDMKLTQSVVPTERKGAPATTGSDSDNGAALAALLEKAPAA